MHVWVSFATCLHLSLASIPFHAEIRQVSCASHVNPVLVAAIMETESGGNPKARASASGGGAWGLLQIKESTARFLGFRGPMKKVLLPLVGLRLGVRYLAWQAQRHPYGWDAVAAYNQGTPRWSKDSRRYENQRYVRKVFHTYRRLLRVRHEEEKYLKKIKLRGTLYVKN